MPSELTLSANGSQLDTAIIHTAAYTNVLTILTDRAQRPADPLHFS